MTNIKNIPIYGQFHNGCGLASLLMLVNPEEKTEVKIFLDQMWEALDPVFGDYAYKGSEYQWAIVLQYLFLKLAGYSDDEEKQELYQMLNERMNWAFEDVRFLNKNEQQDQKQKLMEQGKTNEAHTYIHYLEENDYITPLIIMKNLHIMKTDMQLRLLAEIFNYQFLYQQFDDITGGISFSKKEIRKKKIKKKTTKEKWLTLEKYANDPDCIILYGKAHHWLAVRGIYRLFQLEEQKCTKEEDEETGEAQNSKKEFKKDQGRESTSETDQTTKKEEKAKGDTDSDSDRNLDEKTKKDPNKKYTVHKWQTKQMIIDLNDPAQKRRIKINYRAVAVHDRFLIFKKRDLETYDFFAPILKIVENDVVIESEIWDQYLIKRNKIESKINAERRAQSEAKRKKERIADSEKDKPSPKKSDKFPPSGEVAKKIEQVESKIEEAADESDNVAFLDMIDLDEEEKVQKNFQEKKE